MVRFVHGWLFGPVEHIETFREEDLDRRRIVLAYSHVYTVWVPLVNGWLRSDMSTVRLGPEDFMHVILDRPLKVSVLSCFGTYIYTFIISIN